MELPDNDADLGQFVRDLLSGDFLILDGRILAIAEIENMAYDDGYITYGVIVVDNEDED